MNVCADEGVLQSEILSGLSTTTKLPHPPLFNPVELPVPSGQIPTVFLVIQSDIKGVQEELHF